MTCSVCGLYRSTISDSAVTVLHTSEQDRFVIEYAVGERESVGRNEVVERIHDGLLIAAPPDEQVCG